MPCRVDESPREIRERAEEDFLHNSKLADMFCAVMKNLEIHGNLAAVYNSMSGKKQEKVRAWWEDHKERDRKKEDSERRDRDEHMKRTAALEKLTPEERDLLGVRKR